MSAYDGIPSASYDAWATTEPEPDLRCAGCLEPVDSEDDLTDADGDYLCRTCLREWAAARAAERIAEDADEAMDRLLKVLP